MQSGLLTSSSFGKFYPKHGQKARTVELATSSPLLEAQFSITGERLYLLDGSGNLTCLSLDDSSISTFNSIKLGHFSIQSNNAYSIYAVSKQSELWHISFESKKKTKIFNLNMCKVISFDKNHFTNLFLIVEFQIAMIFDLNSNSNKIKSLKANNGEVFTAGRFLGKNRFLILAVKNKQLRLVEILGMKTQDQLVLPIQIKGIKIESTMDGEKIAVFGESDALIIVSINKGKIVSYQMLKLPVKSILALKFTSDHDVVLLAGNRVLYAINQNKEMVQLYNETKKTPFNNFDISLNSQSIVLTAGKQVHFLTYPRGIHFQLGETYGVELKFSVYPVSQEQTENRQIQYDEEDQQERQENDQLVSSQIAIPPNLPNFASINSQKVELIPEAQNLKASRRQQVQLNTIYQYLHQFQAARSIVHLHRQAVLYFLHAILDILKDPRQCAIAAYHIFSHLGASINDGSLEKLITMLAPRVYEKIQKANGEFGDFVIQNLLNLFGNFTYNTNNEITKAILQNSHRESFISSFIISMFLHLRANSPSWPSPHLQELKLSQVLEETQNLMSNPRQTYNVQQDHSQEEEDNLQSLMKRQQQIKEELANIKRTYS